MGFNSAFKGLKAVSTWEHE